MYKKCIQINFFLFIFIFCSNTDKKTTEKKTTLLSSIAERFFFRKIHAVYKDTCLLSYSDFEKNLERANEKRKRTSPCDRNKTK